ncbi:uncharacterized protein BP5553_00464 [Venustampulla echinocandica]|uniref:GPI anchored protein n=1 Tax=Venustampulla echinocandica TaxID=2656787 RepID=A0A370TY84_9HELO|nr:uncharacterized protein BP5553_00464 [Venustampulla echinocandica]RDL40485.1 hypothetical protein BP5553_00464 [Venustampulla echinocandica]
MYPTTISVLGLAMAGLSLAQTSTVNLYMPGFDANSFVASVAGSDKAATTYAITCAPTVSLRDCGMRSAILLTEGPATAKFTMSAEVDEKGELAFTGYIDCSLAGTTSAVCVESFGGKDANFPGISTETYSGTDVLYQPVLITARAAAGSGGSPSSVVPSTTKTGSEATNTSGGSMKTSASGATSTGSPQPTSSKSAGVAAVMGNKGWALGGAAVAIAMMG